MHAMIPSGAPAATADYALRSACFFSCFKHDASSLDRRLCSSGVRADDDTVTRLERKECFENGCGCGVCCGDNGCDHADRLRNFFDPCSFVFFDDTAGFRVSILIIDVLSGIVVLDDLVFGKSHARLFCRHDGERKSCFACRKSGCPENGVNLFLVVGCKLVRCRPYIRKFGFKSANAVHFFTCYFHKRLPFLVVCMLTAFDTSAGRFIAAPGICLHGML